jgi:FAD/FMN-containing dehydrogenase
MKKAYLRELQTQLLGSVTDNAHTLDYFSTDGSIFQITPSAVVYPANTADVRKTVSFAADRARLGKPLGITPRGMGTGTEGGAIGEGIELVTPAFMNKLLRLDRDTVTVQPGISFRTLQQTLHTHGRFIPSYPAAIDTATVGGAVASGIVGEKSVKYGPLRDQVTSLKVVLSDGSVIQTKRITSRELNRKKGHSSLEGEIYRKVDSLLLDHPALIKKHFPQTASNNAGYALDKVRAKDGTFDLSALIIGSGGTLGVITEITLRTVAYNPRTTLVVGYFGGADKMTDAVAKLRALGPSALEMVDHNLLELVTLSRPGDLDGLLPDELPKYVVLVQFDDYSQLAQKLKCRRAERIFAKFAKSYRTSQDPVEQLALWKLRHASSAVISLMDTPAAIPVIDDAIVPTVHLASLLDKTNKLLKQNSLDDGLWGHAGTAHVRLGPALDLAKKKDVDRIFSLTKEFHQIIASCGGSPCGSEADGLLKSLYLKEIYGEEVLELFASVKHIFDPEDIFSPMHKTQATEEYSRAHLRDAYSLNHYDHIMFT